MGYIYSNSTRTSAQPPKSGYGFLEAVIEGVISHSAALINVLEEPHRNGGNPGYPALAMLSAYVMQFALREPYANGFLDKLGGNERFLHICGLPCAPSESAYSKFKKKLVEIPDFMDYIDKIIADVFLECGEEIERLREAGIVPADKPPLGESLVMDSTDDEAWARPGRRSRKTGEDKPSKDPNAKWGHRTAKNVRSAKPSSGKRGKGGSSKKGASAGNDTKSGRKESKDEFYFGYKVNVITDADYGLPMFGVTRPANASDVVVMIQDLDDCLALYETLGPRYFLGDKGYDRLENIQHLVSVGLIPVVAVRLPAKDEEGQRLYDGIYEAEGRPTCVGGKPMEYVETDAEKGHLFRCPSEGCHLKGKVHFTRYCDSEHYEKPEGRLLRIVGLLPRCSEEWRAKYKLRTVIERYFSSAKHSRLMNVHRYLNISKVSLHVAMSMLAYLATALAHLQADDYAHMRHMRIRLPKARRREPEQMRERACRDPGCICCCRWRTVA